MGNLEAAETRLSFDDILEAVQDSRRGRWFLTEFEQRIHQRDTQAILNSISRLESRMENLGAGQGSPDDLAKVRGAIANARNDLLKLGLGKQALSKEGRLFAEIAELARKSMPVAVDSNAGIVRTLQLVDEIDTAISGKAPLEKPPADKGAQFFSADAALFEKQASPAKPVVITPPVAVEASPVPVTAPMETPVAAPIAKSPSAAKPEKKEETSPVGARLVIRKVGQAAEDKAPDQPVEAAKPAEPEAVMLAAPPASPPAQHTHDNPRIVIIRRKAEDMPDVDLAVQRSETAA